MSTEVTRRPLMRLAGRTAVGGSTRAGRERRAALALVAPTIVVLLVVVGYPIAWALKLSLYSDVVVGSSGFVGLGNYREALTGAGSAEFYAALRTTFLFTVVAGAIELVVGTVMALGMHHLRRGRGLVRAMVLVPWAIPTAVAVVLWQWMLTPNGIVNAVLGHEILWTGATTPARVAVILIDVWKTAPFIGLLLLAGLQMIPHEIYEAARVDGAGPVTTFTRITLPLLMPTILVAMLFRVLDLLRMYDTPAILTHGANDTTTLSLFTFQNAIDQVKYGYGSALSTLTFIVVFLVALVFIRGFGARVYDEAPVTTKEGR